MPDPAAVVPAPAPAALPARAPEGAACLSNGAYRTLVTARGGGVSTFGEFALTRWSADRVADDEGFFVWLLDRDQGACWSIAASPVAPEASMGGRATVRFAPGAVAFERGEHGVSARLDVAVHPALPLEIRRVTLSHAGAEPRTLEACAALDVVLHERAADASHPAFSRLFVQTEWAAEEGTLLARRRPRGAGERFPWIGLAVLEEPAPGYESDRARFLGRTADRTRPRGLIDGGPWAGTVGNVLDPVLALRVRRRLEPGDEATFTFALVAGPDRASVLAAVAAARAEGGAGILAAAGADARIHEAADLAALGWAGAAEPQSGTIAGAAVARPAASAAPLSTPHLPDDEPLEFWNGYGGFAPGGREYVIRFAAGDAGGATRPPQPWVNVLANEHFGALVSETGAGTTWSVNSREHRLTPWSNDPLVDPHGEALYLRDADTGALASPLPGPAAGTGACETRHGFGITRFFRNLPGLSCASEVFVPRADALKIVRVSVTNVGAAPRRLTFAAYQRLVLGALPEETAATIVTEAGGAGETAALYAQNPGSPLHPGRVAFAAILGAGAAPRAFTCDRAAFLGGAGEGVSAPRALAAGFDGRSGDGLDPCFAQAVEALIAPGATATWSVLLGDAADRPAADALLERYRAPGAIEAARDEALAWWAELLSFVQVETPAPAIDRMVNGWLLYQTVACRLWGRTAFYQSGGAFGFRDQLQDAAALLHADPAMFREQILRNAAHQFVEGDVMHWWHPPDARGLRTRFADDLLWLPWLAATYVGATGDRAVLAERVRFVTAPPLAPGEDEIFLAAVPAPASEDADVYEHACRAIERSLAVGVGAHGLPLFGCGDWNDGMNRVGHEGRGESVWMAMFQFTVLADFAPLCRARGDAARAARYDAERVRLSEVLETAGWDGAWYRRGYYDDGTPLGTAEGDECRIDALAQAWAVLSRAVPRARADQAMDEVERHLVADEAGLIRLLAPPFEHTPHDPGYIKGYVPGVRENGGQYTHAALWVVRAMAELGRRDRAAHLLELLSPVSHAQTREQVALYQVEPYVVAADVYGAAPHVGRGGWTWYTGSAGWMLRVALESVLGVTIEGGDTLVVRPCIPDDWPGFRVTRRLPDGSSYRIEVRAAAAGPSEHVAVATIDGAPAPIVDGSARVSLLADAREHEVVILLGPRA